MTNTLNTPIEELELSYPLRVSEYRLAATPIHESAGVHLGGRGLVRTYMFLKDGEATLIGERHTSSPKSIRTEAAVQLAEHTLVRANGTRERLSSKTRLKVSEGESIELKTAGGGHWKSSN